MPFYGSSGRGKVTTLITKFSRLRVAEKGAGPPVGVSAPAGGLRSGQCEPQRDFISTLGGLSSKAKPAKLAITAETAFRGDARMHAGEREEATMLVVVMLTERLEGESDAGLV